MLNRMTVLIVCTAAVLALAAVVVAQNAQAAERFSFVAANATKAGPSGEGRCGLSSTNGRLMPSVTG
jgi:uncharacterized low-complexity protein